MLKVVLITGIVVIIPPYATSNFSLPEVLEINSYILTNSIRRDFSALFPFFNGLTLLILLGTVFFGKVFSKPFAALMSLNYVLSGLLQNISISDRYGFAINSSTLLLTLFVAGSWIFELISNQNDFSKNPPPRHWVFLLPISLFALWQPINPATMAFDFRIIYFLSSGSSLTFCMMTIVSIAVLLVYYPNVNKTTLLITSLVGFLIGVGNLWLEFLHLPGLFWVGILHIPLVCISIIGISFYLRTN